MGKLRTKGAKFLYKEYDRLLMEQFISGIDDNGMMNEIIKEVATLQDIRYPAGKCMLLWAHNIEVQRAQNQDLMTYKRKKMILSTEHRSKNLQHLWYRKK